MKLEMKMENATPWSLQRFLIYHTCNRVWIILAVTLLLRMQPCRSCRQFLSWSYVIIACWMPSVRSVRLCLGYSKCTFYSSTQVFEERTAVKSLPERCHMFFGSCVMNQFACQTLPLKVHKCHREVSTW